VSISSIDIERMLAECVPGGSSCDPQQVADAIRSYCNAWGATSAPTQTAVPAGPTFDDAVAAVDATLHHAIDYWQDRASQAMAALAEADRIMGHDDTATEWRERWAHLWGEAWPNAERANVIGRITDEARG
jgi:hypothetical protein